MRAWLSLRNFVFLFGLTALTLLLIWGGLALGADWLVPTPQAVAEEFVGTLGAHQYAGALNALHTRQRQAVTADTLADLIAAIESAHSPVDFASAQSAQADEDTASVELEIQFQNGSRQNITLPLAREKYLWRVTSIDPLRALAAPPDD